MNEKSSFALFERFMNYSRLNVLEHGLYCGDGGWNYEGIVSPYHRLYFVISGSPVIIENNTVIALKPHHAYFIPANVEHHYRATAIFKKFYIHFTLKIFDCIDVFSHITQCTELPFSNQQTSCLLAGIQDGALSSQLSSHRIVYEVLEGLAGRVDLDLAAALNKHFELEEIYKFICCNHSISLQSHDIASHFNASTSLLNKRFRMLHQMTIKQYNDRYIMEEAKSLLAVSRLSVKEIAYQLGFTDPYYFSKQFKKHSGMPPNVYRKRQKTFMPPQA